MIFYYLLEVLFILCSINKALGRVHGTNKSPSSTLLLKISYGCYIFIFLYQHTHGEQYCVKLNDYRVTSVIIGQTVLCLYKLCSIQTPAEHFILRINRP